MVDNSTWGTGTAGARAPGSSREFSFSLKLRVDAPAQLWQAAAMLCMSRSQLSQDEIEELIGPVEDPSIADCLMILALPEQIPGCTRLDIPAFALAADWTRSEAAVRRS